MPPWHFYLGAEKPNSSSLCTYFTRCVCLFTCFNCFFCMCVLCRFTSVFVCLLISESVMAGVNVRCIFLCLSIFKF